ncbi:hypothetical protein SCA6_008362 [Theobroma cacao]
MPTVWEDHIKPVDIPATEQQSSCLNLSFSFSLFQPNIIKVTQSNCRLNSAPVFVIYSPSCQDDQQMSNWSCVMHSGTSVSSSDDIFYLEHSAKEAAFIIKPCLR